MSCLISWLSFYCTNQCGLSPSDQQLHEMLVLHQNIMGDCPGGGCEYLLQFSEVLIVLLLADGFIFLVTLIPPLFSWKNKKPDSKNRIFFAVFSCVTFYFWLSVLAVNSLYCFGFLSHAGPCNSSTSQPAPVLGQQISYTQLVFNTSKYTKWSSPRKTYFFSR